MNKTKTKKFMCIIKSGKKKIYNKKKYHIFVKEYFVYRIYVHILEIYLRVQLTYM